MIVNRVSALMGERRVSIRDLATGAGLSYTTAHALYHDAVRRWDAETLDKLCRYFGVGVGEVLVYAPAGVKGDTGR